MSRRGALLVIWLAGFCLLRPAAANAQGEFMLRGFADLGSTSFAAQQSFEAILGSRSGRVFGGGVEAVLPQRVFVSLRASRFQRTGERVFLFGGQQFDLGIPATITIQPVLLTGGYRFDYGWRVFPYAGAGIGWHRYRETSDFATADENVDEQHQGYHLLGGAEVRVVRWLAAAFEAEWSRVPESLGTDPNSVSHEFKETDLGGATLRVKVVLGM